jgi:hypothetical protein
VLDDNRWSVRMCGEYRCTESHDGTTEDCGGREETRREERDVHTSSVSITLRSHMIWPLVGV